jgi:hypothetical protein
MSEIQELTRAILALKEDLDERHEQNTSHYFDMREQIRQLGDRVDRLASGFPGGDPVIHASWHDKQSAKEARRSKRLEKTIEGFSAPALLAIVAGVLTFLWQLIKEHFHWK